MGKSATTEELHVTYKLQVVIFCCARYDFQLGRYAELVTGLGQGQARAHKEIMGMRCRYGSQPS